MRRLFPFLAVLTLLLAPAARAHELLPAQLVEFMETHPDATLEELEAFLDANPGMDGDGVQGRAATLEAVRGAQPQGFWHTAWQFFGLGVEHILSGPDHILFVLSLILVFTSLRSVLKTVTAFTVSHSVTILLAGSDLLRVSASIVEPMIALSIAYVALTTVFLRHRPFFASRRNTLLSVFFFGLFHGMGFAGLLQELSVPRGSGFFTALISFNAGIEAGQMLILLAAVPLVYAFRRKRWYPAAMRVLAVMISVLAVFWMGQRLLGA